MELVSTMEINGEEREIADAVARGQIDGVNSNLTDLAFGENSGSANIFNGKIVGGLLIETGEISGSLTTRITSDFIPVEPNTLYTQIAPTSAKRGRYCEYDANKNLVYFDQDGLQDTFTTKPTTKYLRISFGSEYGTTFKNDIAIIKGNATEYVPYIPSVKMLAEEVSAQKNDLSKQCKKDDITTNETLIGTFNGKNYYRKLFTGISGSGGSVTVNVGEKIEIYNYYGRAYVYGQSGASNAKYPIPNMNYYIESQNSGETSFQLTVPTSSDTRKVDLVIEYTKVDE